MVRFLDTARRLHETLTAEKFDVRTDERFDDIQHFGIRRVTHEDGIVLSTLVDLPDGGVTEDSVGSWFELDGSDGKRRNCSSCNFRHPTTEYFHLSDRKQVIADEVAFGFIVSNL